MKSPLRYVDVFDSELSDLQDMLGREFESPDVEYYARIMLAYFAGNSRELESLVLDPACSPIDAANGEALRACALVRLQILKNAIDPEIVPRLIKAAERGDVWEGEALALAAYACDLTGDHERCRDCNLRAFRALDRIGAKRKAVRMLANHVAAQSRIDKNRHYIPDLLYLYKRARQVRDITAKAMALTHLSREYQCLGAWEVALSFATKAVAVASQNGGNLTYYTTLAQRCHVLAQLGCIREAKMTFQLASSCGFPTVLAALDVIAKGFPKVAERVTVKMNDGGHALMTQFWEKRLDETPARRLSKLEEKLITFLSEKPRTKREITSHLYGDRISEKSADGRLFTLLGRLKKRHPDLIQFVHGKYRLKEEPFLEDVVA